MKNHINPCNSNHNTNHNSKLVAVFIFLPFLLGLFFDYFVCFSGTILIVLLFLFRKSSKELNEVSIKKSKYSGYVIYKNIYSVTVLLYMLFSFLTLFYGVDKGMSFIVFLRFIKTNIKYNYYTENNK